MDGSLQDVPVVLKGVGIGVYSATDAQRLLGIPAASIRRWVRGTAHHDPLWKSQHDYWHGPLLIGFRDLIEARIVHELRKRGFSEQELRGAIDYARQQIGDERPFSTKLFKTAGKDILLDLPEGPLTVSRKNRGQSVFREAIAPILKPIEYGDHAAESLWLHPTKRNIILDPTRSFGAPILHEWSIPTDVIAKSVAAEGSETVTARYFEIPVRLVREAVKFEEKLAA